LTCHRFLPCCTLLAAMYFNLILLGAGDPEIPHVFVAADLGFGELAVFAEQDVEAQTGKCDPHKGYRK
jgi:hypothetical protein